MGIIILSFADDKTEGCGNFTIFFSPQGYATRNQNQAFLTPGSGFFLFTLGQLLGKERKEDEERILT